MCVVLFSPANKNCMVQNWGGENFGELGKLNVICQYFTKPNLILFFVKLVTSG